MYILYKSKRKIYSMTLIRCTQWQIQYKMSQGCYLHSEWLFHISDFQIPFANSISPKTPSPKRQKHRIPSGQITHLNIVQAQSHKGVLSHRRYHLQESLLLSYIQSCSSILLPLQWVKSPRKLLYLVSIFPHILLSKVQER